MRACEIRRQEGACGPLVGGCTVAHARRRQPASLSCSTAVLRVWFLVYGSYVWYSSWYLVPAAMYLSVICVSFIRRDDTQPASQPRVAVQQYQAHAWTWIASRSGDYTTPNRAICAFFYSTFVALLVVHVWVIYLFICCVIPGILCNQMARICLSKYRWLGWTTSTYLLSVGSNACNVSFLQFPFISSSWGRLMSDRRWRSVIPGILQLYMLHPIGHGL